MVLKKWFYTACIFTLIAAPYANSQDEKVTSLPGTSDQNTFKLEPGASFNATPLTRKAGSERSSIRREAITSDLTEALAIINANYAGQETKRSADLVSSAVRSMLKTLDPHSNYYSASEYQELLGQHKSEYTGTGSSIAGFYRNGDLDTYILAAFPGSPASAAGLRYGDKIISVDGQNVRGQMPDTVRSLVRGKRGTPVSLLVERIGVEKPIEIKMKRDRVHEPAVPEGFFVRPGTGYIDLTNGFNNATYTEFDIAFRNLKRKGMNSLILDVRGNRGGVLEQAVKVAERFLPSGTLIVSQRGRSVYDTMEWRSRNQMPETLPVVILVDNESASASEILAGALQDNDRAIIMGEKTFGKGLVQSVVGLPEGAGLTLTAARYYTPTGRSIQRSYENVGLYDYYNNRGKVAEIDRSVYAAKTITDRVVYGGDGISPDEAFRTAETTERQTLLLDPIFHFVREYSGRQDLDRHVVERSDASDKILIDEFRSFMASKAPEINIEKELGYITKTIRYYMAMKMSGMGSASIAKINYDPIIEKAHKAIPRAEALASAAGKARAHTAKRKSSSSLTPNELR